MPRTPLINPRLPDPIGYSRAVRVSNGPSIFTSMTAPVAPDGSVVAPGDAYGQSVQILTNIGDILGDNQSGLADVAHITAFVVDEADVEFVMRAIGECFGPSLPAVSMAAGVSLPNPSFLVEDRGHRDFGGVVTVLIAGAGPVGLTLATLLGSYNLPVIVFEREPSLNLRSQASTFHASTLELLDEIDMAWPLIDTGKVTQRLQYRDRDEGFVAEFDFNLLRGMTQFPIRLQTNQTELTRLLHDELHRRYPSVEVRFGTKVVAARESASGPILITHEGSTEREWTGRVVVGADGAHSAVRRSVGIRFEGSSYLTRHLMITTTYDTLSKLPDYAPVTYIFDGDESMGVLTLRDCSRIVFIISGSESDEEILDSENLQRRLATLLPAQAEPYPIVDARIAKLHQRVADRYTQGAIVLAGDSAHLNHPLGGMGLNSGIHDAYALGRTIRKLIGEGNDEAVLRDYGADRRHQAVMHVIPTSDEYSRASGETSEEARRRRNEEIECRGR